MFYPLEISFKVLALAQQFSVNDANGQTLLYVKQQMFKLKEAVKVYSSAEQTQLLYEIKADRMLDFSATYRITDANGQALGAVQRKGMRSLWKAHYEIRDAHERDLFSINEANPWTKVLDGILSEIPVVGMFTGYFLHPAYLISRLDGTEVFRVQKKPAFFEGRFAVEVLAQSSDEEARLCLLSAMMLLLLERRRG